MQTKIVLVSDDNNFFEYIVPILSVRKSDELFKFNFQELPEKVHLLNSSVLIVNSENSQENTLELLELINQPTIVFGYNNDKDFKIKAFNAGMFEYITLDSPPEEINAKLSLAFKYSDSIEKGKMYREILVSNNLITKNNEVFLDCNNLLDRELEKIHNNSINAVLVAIAPDDKSKFLIQSNQIETAIINNIRKNDILINFAANKYFLILYNTELNKAKEIWNKISSNFSEPVYAGFSVITKNDRQHLVNDVLNKLHREICKDTKSYTVTDTITGGNFKSFRNDFNKKLKQIILPVFYQIQQSYNDKLFGMKIEQGMGDGYSILYIKAKHATGTFRVTSPGFSTINIDITCEKTNSIADAKRISIEPEELEQGLLQDLIEQFISDFKKEAENVNT